MLIVREISSSLRRLGVCSALIALPLLTNATENGASVYPAGVETILPGMTPPPGSTMFLLFECFYETNELTDSHGHTRVPGFHLRVEGTAPKIVHNWGVHFLGGSLVSTLAVPVLYQHISAPFGQQGKVGVGNPDIGVAQIAYNKGNWHWWYGFNVYTPGFSYNKNDLINIGQHNYATGVTTAVTYLPDKSQMELSSRFEYFVNYSNPVTHYHSGNEVSWEYAAMRRVRGGAWVGVNGYLYRQSTADFQNGALVGDGNRGRVFAVGPEIRGHLARYTVILKYQKEVLAQNRTQGSLFWLQFGVPLGHGERPSRD